MSATDSNSSEGNTLRVCVCTYVKGQKKESIKQMSTFRESESRILGIFCVMLATFISG